jgi:hypothetical protein
MRLPAAFSCYRATHLVGACTTFPLGKSIFDAAKHRKLDPVSVLVLLGIGASAGGILLGGSPRLLLMRESLFTAVFGLICFASLLLPRPMMFHFGQEFIAGDDLVKRRRYQTSWALPEVRVTSRLITVVWGSVYLGEFAIRMALIFLVPVEWVLVIFSGAPGNPDASYDCMGLSLCEEGAGTGAAEGR